MPKFSVAVEWMVCGSYIVEAEDIDSAISQIEDDDGEKSKLDDIETDYVDNSFRVNRDFCFKIEEK